MKTIHVVIPTYNEGDVTELVQAIGVSLINLEDYLLNFLIVDDGSDIPTICTVENSSFFSVIIERLPQNVGPGGAFASGFRLLPRIMSPQDIVILLEGDGTSDPKLIEKMIRRLNEQPLPFDLVLASPYAYGGALKSISIYRRVLSSLANESSRLILDLRGLWTLSSFFRVFRGSSFTTLQNTYGRGVIESKGFECMLELLVKSKAIGFSISEVASIVDQDLRVGPSRMKITKTIIGYMKVWKIARTLSNRNTNILNQDHA